MQQICKRMLSVLLAVAVLLSLTVTAFAADGDADTVLTAADYAAADALFDALDGVEQTAAQRDASTGGRTQAICDYLNAQDEVVSGSVETSGDQITWLTEQGIACAYSPRLEQIAAAAEPVADRHRRADAVVSGHPQRCLRHHELSPQDDGQAGTPLTDFRMKGMPRPERSAASLFAGRNQNPMKSV